MLPAVTVIIPTRNRPEQLARCLEALSAQELPDERFEVVVVDDGSREPVAAAAEPFRAKLGLTLLRQPHAGPAAARNLGLARARGGVVAFTDDDCLPQRDWLAELLAASRARPGALLGGKVLNSLAHDHYAETSQLIIDIVYEHFNGGPDGASFFTSNNIAAPTARVREMGGFDESFLLAAAEDRDFCRRWKARGWPMDSAPRAAVGHVHAADLREFWSMHFRYGRGAWLLRRKSAGRGQATPPAEKGFYRHLLRRIVDRLAREPVDARPRLLLSLLLWQAANIAGFAAQAIARQPPTPAENAAHN
jgi:glycosyltransferase involved in cell wall biosynthesis